MRLILVRHAEAEVESAGTMGDFGRALTPRGRAQAADTSEFLLGQKSKKKRVVHIWTSPFVRAVQTAEELATRLTEVTVSVAEALGSGQSAARELQFCATLDPEQDAVLVGHEPLLSELGAELLGRRALPFGFEKAACLVLDKEGSDKRYAFVAYRAPFNHAREVSFDEALAPPRLAESRAITITP